MSNSEGQNSHIISALKLFTIWTPDPLSRRCKEPSFTCWVFLLIKKQNIWRSVLKMCFPIRTGFISPQVYICLIWSDLERRSVTKGAAPDKSIDKMGVCEGRVLCCEWPDIVFREANFLKYRKGMWLSCTLQKSSSIDLGALGHWNTFLPLEMQMAWKY